MDVQRPARATVGVAQDVWSYLCLILGGLGFCLCFLSELLHNDHSSESMTALMGAGVCVALLGPAVMMTGHSMHSNEFRLWQPFFGGVNFVLMQIFGWTFYGVSVMLIIVLRASEPATHRVGPQPALGSLILASAMLLRTSFSYFDPAAPLPWFSARLITRSNGVALLSLVFALFKSILIDTWQFISPYKAPLYGFTLVECAFAELVVLYHRPPRSADGWLGGGFTFHVMHACGVAGMLISTYLHWVLLGFGEEHPPGVKFAVTFLSASSIVLHILAYDCFDARATRALFRQLRVSSSTAVLLALSLFTTVVETTVTLAGGGRLPFLGTPLAFSHFSFSPLIHVFALSSHRHFRLWQPFVGGTRFVVLQALGWAVYSVTLLVTLMVQVNRLPGQWLVSMFSTTATVSIAVSLSFFDSTAALAAARPRRRRGALLSGELITSCLFTLAGLLMFGVADARLLPAFPPEQLVVFGGVLLAAAVPLGHLSGRWMHPTFKFFQPFEGGPDFIALQAVGWSLYGVMAPLLIILWLNLNLAPDTVRRGVIFTTGLFGLAPYCCILVSLYCFSTRGDEPETIEAIIRDAARLLRRAETNQLRQLLLDVVREHEGGEEYLSTLTAAEEAKPLTYIAITLSAASFFGMAGTEVLCYILSSHLRWVVGMSMSLVCLIASWVAAVTVHAFVGRRRFEDYTLWQPFQGGYNFVLLQTFAWTFLSLQVLVCCVVLFSSWAQLAVGYFLLMAFFGFTGDMLLLLSLSQYRSNTAEAESQSENESFLRRNAEWCVGALLTLCGVLLLVVTKLIVEWDGDFIASAPAIFLSLLACMSGVPLAIYAVWKQAKNSSEYHHHMEQSSQGGSSRARIVDGVELPPLVADEGASSPFTVLSELLLMAIAAVWLLAEGFSYVPYRWLIYVACGILSLHGLTLMVLFRYQKRSFSFIAAELRAEVVTFLFYSLNAITSVGWIYLCFGLLTPCFSTVMCYVAICILSTGNRMALPVARAIVILTFLHGLSLIGSARVAAMKEATERGATDVAPPFFTPEMPPVIMTILLLAYCTTYNPAELTDGSRSHQGIRSQRWLWDSIARYFSFQIKAHYLPPGSAGGTSTATPPKEIFCLHPHGVCPYTALWAPLSSTWTTHGLPSSVIVHVSSALLAVPLLRDALLAIGVADVSEAALNTAFDQSNAVMLVPGGMSEMLESSVGAHVMTIVSRHKGMFRHALLHGASLVPMISFGENDILSTVQLPTILHRWLVAHFGVVYPQLPMGRLMLPLPRRIPLKLVVGETITVPKRRDPRPSEIDALHKEYYRRLHRLFEDHKAECGYPVMQMKFLD